MGISMTQPISEKQRRHLKSRLRERKDLSSNMKAYYEEKIDNYEYR